MLVAKLRKALLAKGIKFNFRNFPLLSPRKSRGDNGTFYINAIDFYDNNRFAIFSSTNTSEDSEIEVSQIIPNNSSLSHGNFIMKRSYS